MVKISIEVGGVDGQCGSCPNIAGMRDAYRGKTVYRCEIFHVTLAYKDDQYQRCDACLEAEVEPDNDGD